MATVADFKGRRFPAIFYHLRLMGSFVFLWCHNTISLLIIFFKKYRAKCGRLRLKATFRGRLTGVVRRRDVFIGK